MKLLSRDDFREMVQARDGHKCVFCGETENLDSHHILERRLFQDGGYYLENGATVCSKHHILCEETTISVEEVREAARITKICVPDHLYDNQIYDKWGNSVFPDGTRTRGELFYDASVQKILKQGGFLDSFTHYIKYPRSLHVPWSPGIHDDDKALKTMNHFIGKAVVISRKQDGENTTIYTDHIHARSIDSAGGEDRAWVKQFWSTFAHDIPVGWRICGENVWAEHSIHYDNLESYFYGFSIWDEMNNALSWNDTLEYFHYFGITPVPVLFRGVYDESNKELQEVLKGPKDTSKEEGYVIRLEDSFKFADFKTSVAKWVRPGHVQTTKHWRAGRQFIKNGLKSV